MKVFSSENIYVVESAQVIKNTEGRDEVIVIQRDDGYSTGVIVHSMLFKGFREEPGRTYAFLQPWGYRKPRKRGHGMRHR